jgi:hypothetical protein
MFSHLNVKIKTSLLPCRMKRVVKIKVMIEMALLDHVLVIGTLYHDLRVAVTQEQTFFAVSQQGCEKHNFFYRSLN